jgi:hypothetical protein
MMYEAQRQKILSLAAEKGYSIERGILQSKTFRSFGLEYLEDMTVSQADTIISLLINAAPRSKQPLAKAS